MKTKTKTIDTIKTIKTIEMEASAETSIAKIRGAEMEMAIETGLELTAGDVYDALQELVACARTRALMGERCEALRLFAKAQQDYALYRDVLLGLPLHALDHALTETMQVLRVEHPLESVSETAFEVPAEIPTPIPAPPKPKGRRKTKQAA